LRHEEFLDNLLAAANGRKFKSKTWVNYPNSIFYYWENEEPNGNNEIGIYTGLRAWGIYI
jgi:hypothetical protein